MKKDTFAIIIPTYNCPDPLRGILESLKRQMVDFPQTEIIVVDDGGKDDLSWVREYPNTILFRQRNGGAASARNRGMDLADTEYIAFLDSDDEIYSNYMPTIYADMRDGYAWVSYDWHSDGSTEWMKQTDEPLMINCAMWAYCFRADLIGDKRVPEHMVLAEDQAWLHMVLRDDVPHKHSHTIFYNYLWHGNVDSVVHRYMRGELGKTRDNGKMREFKNVFCVAGIGPIGGIETMFYNLALKYGKDYDITIVYQNCDPKQLARLKPHIRMIRWRNDLRIKCEKVFFNFNLDNIQYIDADEYYQVIHCDYDKNGLHYVSHPDINKFVAVCENNAKVFKRQSGHDAEICYNPLVVTKPPKMLRLISATRLTAEKGANRMKQLADALDKANIPYTWEIFTNSSVHNMADNPNVVYRDIRLDILPNIAAADYLVQLSDTEGYSYSIIEALSVGTPVIITDFPSASEMQVEDGKNGFILPMDMSNIPVDRIYKGLKRFKYVPHEDRWGEILAPGAGNYEEEKMLPVMVKTRVYYYDIVLEKYMSVGEEQEVTPERADRLIELGVADYA